MKGGLIAVLALPALFVLSSLVASCSALLIPCRHHDAMITAASSSRFVPQTITPLFSHDVCRLAEDAGPVHDQCHLTQEQIERAIAGRWQYQQGKQFAKADQILQALNKAGVFVHDQRNEWRADGLKSFGGKRYQRRGPIPDGVAKQEVRQISLLVDQRSHAKRQRDFQQSDQLEARLKAKYTKAEYRIQLDDKRREWSFAMANDGLYVPSPLIADSDEDDPTHSLLKNDPAAKSEIEQMLQERAAARACKDYSSADALRNTLQEKYQVVVDDRTREWKVCGIDDNDMDPFVVDALTSQRSAFAQNNNNHQPSATVEIPSSLSSETRLNQQHNEQESPAADAIPTAADTDTDNHHSTSSSTSSRESLNKLTVVVLKERLRVADLPVSGNKNVLVDRLLSAPKHIL